MVTEKNIPPDRPKERGNIQGHRLRLKYPFMSSVACAKIPYAYMVLRESRNLTQNSSSWFEAHIKGPTINNRRKSTCKY